MKFRMKELMKGTHHFVDPELGAPHNRELYFLIEWGQSVPSFLFPLSNKCLRADARGIINVSGLTEGDVPVEGGFELNYLSERILRYTLSFEVDKEKYLYVGEKRDVKLWQPWLLVKTHTTCYGTIVNSKGRLISHSITHFGMDPKTIMGFMTSFRLGRTFAF